ncbi:MAG: ABC transporter substrate-binding protein [Thermoproteus sp.]|nr:ABC transporter substrate-binding protein [Thermoproteus sp.]
MFLSTSCCVAQSKNIVTETLQAPTSSSTPTAPPKKELKIGFVTFLSGPAAAPFGIPAKNGALAIADYINRTGGILGAKVVLDIRDEAGGPNQMVSLYRDVAQTDDVYVGLISSADCLAVAPVAEELKSTLTIFFDCATQQLVDKNMMKYVTFRTGSSTTMDVAAAVQYILEKAPDIKTVAGLNQDYAYGRDNWNDFINILQAVKPDVQILDSLFTPLFTSDYSAQIAKLKGYKPDLFMTSLWGGDLVNFLQQALATGFFNSVKYAVFIRGEAGLPALGSAMPDGLFIQAPNYFLLPDPRFYQLNADFINLYKSIAGSYPIYPAYHAANAIMAVKFAYEAAAAVYGVQWPDLSQVIKVFERLAFLTPYGWISMRPNHQAAKGVVMGTTQSSPKFAFKILSDKRFYPAAEITPPTGMTSSDWINYIKSYAGLA